MQTAHSEDWRPGFAKRAENFSEVCAQAEGWRWNPGETIARVAGAVLKGTPSLTIPQRMTLLIYVEHLNQDRLEQDIACVWPSTALVAEYLGCSQSQARANRRALEAAGFLVRDYTKANRPAGVEAYDLRPLMARQGESSLRRAVWIKARCGRRICWRLTRAARCSAGMGGLRQRPVCMAWCIAAGNMRARSFTCTRCGIRCFPTGLGRRAVS